MPQRLGSFLRVLVSIGLIVGLLALGAVVGGWLFSLRTEPPRKTLESLPPLVEAIVIRRHDVVEHFTGYGSARANRIATLSSEVAATVVEVVDRVRTGSPVEAGQPLIRLDSRQYEHDLAFAVAQADGQAAMLQQLDIEAAKLELMKASAQEEVRIAADEVARLATLMETQDAQKREHDLTKMVYQQAVRVRQNLEKDLESIPSRRAQAEATLRGYRAAADAARLNVERCTIVAPFDGRLESMLVEVGDRVGPGSPLAVVLDASHVEIPIQLPASLASSVDVGAACRIETEQGNAAWTGSVVRVSPMADERMRTFGAYVEVDNEGLAQPLMPGSFVRATVAGPTHEDAVVVPRGAIRRGSVFMVEGDHARRVPVRIERFLGEGALVQADLPDGAVVILSHLDTLAEGAPVRFEVIPEASDAAAAEARLSAGALPEAAP
jgi:RND family efflux transporter MFP subunit